jgi:hypothetical protein
MTFQFHSVAVGDWLLWTFLPTPTLTLILGFELKLVPGMDRHSCSIGTISK